MSTTDRHDINARTDPRRAARRGIIPATIDLGTDADGRQHIFRTLTRAVHVVDADTGERVHVAYIGDRPLDDWMAFVAEDLGGWAERRYGLTLGEMLAAAMDE